MNQPHDPYQAPTSPAPEYQPPTFALRPAGKGRRFLTYLIDYVCFIVCALVFGVALGLAFGERALEMLAGWREYVFSFAILSAYYIVFEGLFARTPGKFACGTRVVDESGGPPSWGQVCGRTFARFIPFEPFSLLLSDDSERTGWHDTLPKTRVVLVDGRG